MIMDIKDAHKVIENLQTRPYICSENTIELDNDYVIVKKAYFKECQEARERQRAKKPLSRTHCKDGKHPLSQDIGRCPSCNGIVAEDMFWCDDCGQKLDWSETV